MDENSILYPLLAMVALVLLVWIGVYVRRVREMRVQRIPVQKLASRASAAQVLKNAGPADNLMNLFELPVLFYVIVILLYVTDRGDTVYLALAWAYVLLRALHSLIHCTYNRVMHRFGVYVLSCLVLWILWGRFALQISGFA